MEIKFVDAPPPAKRAGRAEKWRSVAEELRRHPGQWAIVAEGVNPGMAGHLKTFGLEAVTRHHRLIGTQRRADVYARFVDEVNP